MLREGGEVERMEETMVVGESTVTKVQARTEFQLSDAGQDEGETRDPG